MKIIKTQPGCLTILSGKSGMGKSTISVFDAASNLRDGKTVIYFSYEYCQSIIYNKLVNHFHLKWQELFNLSVVDSEGLPYEAVVDCIKRKKAGSDVIVYIDYLDLLRETTFPKNPDGTRPSNYIHTPDIIAALADLAKSTGIAIVVLFQEKSEASVEESVSKLNSLCAHVEGGNNVIKMFIGRNDLFSSMVQCDDISHVILVEGNSLKHFSSINIKEAYQS